jgi:hypothetical protein
MILLTIPHVLQAKQFCCPACSAIPNQMHNLCHLWLAQKSHDFDYAHASACSAGKTILLSCMFCKYLSKCTILSFVAGKTIMLSCMFCNTRANAQSCLFCGLAQKLQDLISAHDFCMFCRQTIFCPACSAIPEQMHNLVFCGLHRNGMI